MDFKTEAERIYVALLTQYVSTMRRLWCFEPWLVKVAGCENEASACIMKDVVSAGFTQEGDWLISVERDNELMEAFKKKARRSEIARRAAAARWCGKQVEADTNFMVRREEAKFRELPIRLLGWTPALVEENMLGFERVIRDTRIPVASSFPCWWQYCLAIEASANLYFKA